MHSTQSWNYNSPFTSSMRGSTNDRTVVSFFSSINSYSRFPRYYWLSLNKPLPDLPIGHGWLYHSARVGWRPITLMPGFLVGFAILSCILLAILEFMLRRSDGRGAVAFVEVDGQPSFINHCFNFGPLIFGVSYGLLFASIDHEIKRLEAYFQLSNPEGASADDSLLLSYPYMMAITAPFVALRRRHWAVVCSSLATVICLLGITPLSGTIINRKSDIERTESTMFRSISPLENLSNEDAVTAIFSYKAYSRQYSHGDLPPFTHDDFSIVPFVPAQNNSRRKAELWSTNTTLIEAELDCLPAKVEFLIGSGRNQTKITNAEDDCSFILPAVFGDVMMPYTAVMIDENYLRYYNATQSPGKVDCRRQEEILVGFWGKTSMPNQLSDLKAGQNTPQKVSYEKAAAVFCKPVHRKQGVTVTVDSAGKIIGSPSAFAPKSDYTDFDVARWKQLLMGFKVQKKGDEVSDHLSMGLPDHTIQLLKQPQFQNNIFNKTNLINVHLPFPVSLTTFGLSRQQNLEALFVPQNLAHMFSSAYQFLFAVAGGASELVISSPSNPQEFPGSIRYSATGYSIDFIWTRALQACLIAILLLDVAIIIILWNRNCDIGENPGTLASAIACVDPAVLDDFHDAEFLKPSELERRIRDRRRRYRLHDHKISIVTTRESDEESLFHSEERPDGVPPSDHQDRADICISKPVVISPHVGACSAALIIIAIILFSNLYSKASLTGFHKPTHGRLYDFYSSYLPLLLTMLLSNHLSLLTSHITYLHPFQQLTPKSTFHPLTFNFQTTPPHLQFFTGLRNHNPLLSFLSLSILLSNILAIFLGNLFHTIPLPIESPGSVTPLSSLSSLSLFNASTLSKFDPEFLYTTIASNTNSRPWIFDSLYFSPFLDKDPDHGSAGTSPGTKKVNYTAPTFGLGVNIYCQPSSLRYWDSWVSSGQDRDKDMDNKTRQNQTVTYFGRMILSDANLSALVPAIFETNWKGYLDAASATSSSQKTNQGNQTPPPLPDSIYFESGPTQYPRIIAGPPGTNQWEFFLASIKYSFRKKKTRIWPDGTIVSDNFDWNDKHKEIEVWNAYPQAAVIECAISPRIVKAVVTVTEAGRNGRVVGMGNVKALRTGEMGQEMEMGLPGIVERFKELVYRQPIPSSGMGQEARKDGGPRNWVTWLLERECKRTEGDDGKGFMLHRDPMRNAKCMERVYKMLFANYLQLNEGKIFGDREDSEAKSGSEDMKPIPATFSREEERVLMLPVPFWVSISLLASFLPLLYCTYKAHSKGFLTHHPISLARLFAGFYGSNVVTDLGGTNMIRPRGRREFLRKLGGRYWYGWGFGRDGNYRWGIHSQPNQSGLGETPSVGVSMERF